MGTGTVELHRVLRRPEPARPDAGHGPAAAVLCDTDIHIVQQGIPAVIPVEMCHLGWLESPVQLAQLVEPEIPV